MTHQCYYSNFIGIDGSGKTSCLERTAQLLSLEYDKNVLTIGRPFGIYQIGNQTPVFRYATLSNILDRMYNANAPCKKPIETCTSIVYVLLWKALEKKLISEYSPDIVIAERHRGIDSAIMIGHQLPASKNIPLELRFDLLNYIIAPAKSDLLIYLEISAKEAIERITKRNGFSNKPHTHETVSNLEELSKNYEALLALLKSRSWNILRINSFNTKIEEISQIVAKKINKEQSK